MKAFTAIVALLASAVMALPTETTNVLENRDTSCHPQCFKQIPQCPPPSVSLIYQKFQPYGSRHNTNNPLASNQGSSTMTHMHIIMPYPSGKQILTSKFLAGQLLAMLRPRLEKKAV